MWPALKIRQAIALTVLAVLATLWFVFSGQDPLPPERTASLPTAPQDIRVLRLGLNIAADSALHAAAMRLAEQVHDRSQGKLKITVHPNQQLGSDDQMLEMARSGKLDLILTPTAKLSSAIPAMQYADLPFYFSERQELYAMLDDEPGRMLLSKLNAIDLVGITFWENGFKQFTANTPLRSPQDFAGLRIRTMKSPLIADQFVSLGARPIPIDFHATYQALSDGAVDGQENPLVAIVGMRFHAVQKHLTLSNHAYLAYVLSASKRVFETLSPEQRETIQRTARELTVWEREETARREVGFLDAVRAAGVTVHTLTEDERKRFGAAMAPVADKFGFEVGYDLLAKTEELRFQARAKDKAPAARPESVVIGIDADLSVRSAQAGGAIYRGVQLAVEEINQQGGVLGRPLQVIARDHAASAQLSRQSLVQFAATPGLVGVLGGTQTPVILETLEEIHRLKIPYLIPWAAGQSLIAHTHQPSYTFRTSITDGQVAPFLLEHALRLGGRVVVVLETSGWGRSNEDALRPIIAKLPPNTVTIDWFTQGENNIDAKLSSPLYRDASAMVLVTNAPESQVIVQAMARLDKPLPIFAHWGLTGANFWEQNQTALQKVRLRFVQSILVDETQIHPKLAAFIQRYRKRFGLAPNTPLPSPAGSVHAYDLTHLLARAVAQASSTDRVAIRDALESLPPYSGLLRVYNPAFAKDRHEALDRSLLHLGRFDDRGHIVLAD
ncbi:MAG: DctP family TRAP transporter solute-binding subunit [Rhodoferax sp.]|nr:DctP family TRAP transporter solute-binding subunit [Rhodoferax sp.]MCF8210277.1 DctP family TRAP transporter solute-binding subunit [Rhodoferax sp.]